jgi:hypothetical protein
MALDAPDAAHFEFITGPIRKEQGRNRSRVQGMLRKRGLTTRLRKGCNQEVLVAEKGRHSLVAGDRLERKGKARRRP